MGAIPLLPAVNARLQGLLSRYAGAGEGSSEAAVSLADLRALQRCLNQIAPHVPELRAQRHLSGSSPVADYFRNLELLIPMLQRAQARLTCQQAELRARGSSLQRAQAWANAYRELLR
jgi:hypothetical protein